MKLVGGMIGALLGLGVAWTAQAAELPTMKPAPTAPVKKCNVGGMAGVLVSSGACVKISGYVSGGVAIGNMKP